MAIPPPTCALSASPVSIAYGDSMVLSWTTSNATSAAIDNGIGPVTPVASGSRNVIPMETTTYTMTTTGSGGSDTCRTTVVVGEVTPIPDPTTGLIVSTTLKGTSIGLTTQVNTDDTFRVTEKPYQVLDLKRLDRSVDGVTISIMEDLDADGDSTFTEEDVTGVGYRVNEELEDFFHFNEGARFGVQATAYNDVNEGEPAYGSLRRGRLTLRVKLPTGNGVYHIALRAFVDTRKVTAQQGYYIPFRFITTDVKATSSSNPSASFYVQKNLNHRPEVGNMSRWGYCCGKG
ncbi:MAG TPA: hypothetical protein VM103_01200 [Candidatus Paceibacterota bacterium]|nr:hypothetical protein [Candidatus Paceibacterota bacterium]